MRDKRVMRDARVLDEGDARGVRDMRGAGSRAAGIAHVARAPRVALVVAVLFALAAALPAWAQSSSRSSRSRSAERRASRLRAPTQAETQTPASTEDADPSAINWDATPVDIVLQAYGERVGKTVLKDPACPSATISLKSRPGQKLTDEEYLEAIEAILEMNGVHLEPYGESFIRALPRKDVRKEGIPLIMDQDA